MPAIKIAAVIRIQTIAEVIGARASYEKIVSKSTRQAVASGATTKGVNSLIAYQMIAFAVAVTWVLARVIGPEG